MKTIKDYRKELVSLFICSVSEDVDKWEREGNSYFSPEYGDIKFHIDTNPLIGIVYLYKKNNGYEFLKCYRLFFIPLSLNLYKIVRKLKNHIIEAEYNNANKERIEKYKGAIDELNVKFVKGIRKGKLEKIKDK